MITTLAPAPHDREAPYRDSPSPHRVLLFALLLSIALHGVLWGYLQRVEIALRDLPDQNTSSVISMRLIKSPPPEIDSDLAVDTASTPTPQVAAEQLPASHDATPEPPPALPLTVQPETPPPISVSTDGPSDAPSGDVDQQGGVIFDSRLRRRLQNVKPTQAARLPGDSGHIDIYGEEWVQQGDSCFKVTPALDHQDQALLGLPTPCKGSSRENDFEQEFRARLKARGLK